MSVVGVIDNLIQNGGLIKVDRFGKNVQKNKIFGEPGRNLDWYVEIMKL